MKDRGLRQPENPDIAWRVFLLLFNERRAMSVTEIGRALGIPRKTAYHHLRALAEGGLAFQNGVLWICQEMFVNERKMGLVLPIYEALVQALIDKMLVPKGVDPAAAVRSAIVALATIFESANGSPEA